MKKNLIIGAAILVLAGLGWSFLRSIGRLHRMNSDGNTLGRLGAIRSALSVYYGDMEGQYPSDLSALIVHHQDPAGGTRNYLRSIQVAQCRSPYHVSPDCSKNMEPGVHDKIRYAPTPDDAGGWGYNSDPKDNLFGTVYVNCTHTDSRGQVFAKF